MSMIIKNGNTFHLQGRNISYIFTVSGSGDLLHYHFGGKLGDRDYSANVGNEFRKLICFDGDNALEGIYSETALREYPEYGHTDLRSPAYTVGNKYGNTITRLKYKSFEIIDNQVAHIEGMPSLFKGDKTAQTLEITLADESIGLEAVLSYTVFDKQDVILRSTRFVNKSDSDMTVESAYSVSVDFDKRDLDIVYFPGAWCREREFVRTPVPFGGKVEASNARGGSGHAMNPFIMLCSKDANEVHGEVYGFSLIYSGNHSSVAECDQYGNIRVRQGINPFGFEYKLSPEEVFYTPQSVLTYSSDGFGGLSREMHDIYRENLCLSKWASKDRPILINNWEGTYFNFNEEKILSMAKKAKEAGVELFVLDDGWFGKRNSNKSSLGDWYVNKDKLPSGIEGLAKKINDEGLAFGLWFEPEMANPDSDLYREHPDWIISVPNLTPALGRNQYMLDLSRDDVCEFIVKSVSDILSSAPIVYVKWDYNRMMADMPCKGYNHRYTLGLYKVLDALIRKFPDVLFEGCAAGGGRFDAGMLAYSPQIWTSDNTDAIARLKIQYSTSICYPLSTISAHITESPNHMVHRDTPLKTRADVALAGMFGYELDITKMTDDEISSVKEITELCKSVRTLVRTGDLYRLQSPYEGNYCSWQIVSKDKSEALVFGCRILNTTNTKESRLTLCGLSAEYEYTDTATGETYGGDELMARGITPDYEEIDFATFVKVLKITK